MSVDDAVARLAGEPARTAATSGPCPYAGRAGLVLIQGLLPRAVEGAWPTAGVTPYPELAGPVPGRRVRICSWHGQRHRLAAERRLEEAGQLAPAQPCALANQPPSSTGCRAAGAQPQESGLADPCRERQSKLWLRGPDRALRAWPGPVVRQRKCSPGRGRAVATRGATRRVRGASPPAQGRRRCRAAGRLARGRRPGSRAVPLAGPDRRGAAPSGTGRLVRCAGRAGSTTPGQAGSGDQPGPSGSGGCRGGRGGPTAAGRPKSRSRRRRRPCPARRSQPATAPANPRRSRRRSAGHGSGRAARDGWRASRSRLDPGPWWAVWLELRRLRSATWVDHGQHPDSTQPSAATAMDIGGQRCAKVRHEMSQTPSPAHLPEVTTLREEIIGGLRPAGAPRRPRAGRQPEQ